MAYSDYQPTQQPTKKPMGPLGPLMGESSQLPGLEPGFIMGQGQPQQPQQQGGDPAPLPTNTRAGALQQVQNAYAGRMPGQMDALNSALSQFAAPVGLNDPGIQPALRAGAMSDQRTFERGRAALAEQLGANGLGDSGALNTMTLGLNQRIGEAGAQRDANLVYDEMGARRGALLSALGLDQSRYGVDQNLGYQLAALQAALNNQAVQPFF